MGNGNFAAFFNCKRGDTEFATKNLIYWVLIFGFVIIIWFIVNGIIDKLLTLY